MIHRKCGKFIIVKYKTWEQRKVSDVAKIIAGGTPSTKENSYWEPKEIPWLSSGEVHKKYITFTDDMISQIGMNNSSAKMVAKDSVLIALAGQGKTRGTVAINRIPLTTNQSIAAMTFNEDFIPEFVFYNLENRYDELRRMSSGDGSRGGLNKQLVGDIEIPYTEKEEQERIGSFFESLDNLITLHQRECEDTKKLKKYMLQKMFPQNVSKVPEIRFKGFTDDWEQRKFSEFVNNVARKNKDNLDLEPYAVTNDRGFIAQKDAHDDFGYMKETDRRAYNIVPPNSFAYNPARINVGSLGYYTGSENVIVSSLYEVFQTEDYIDDRFLWHWLKSNHFPKWIEKLQEGSVRLYFYFDKLVQCQMMVPTIKEQKQISTYFDSIDHLITLHQRECSTW